MTAMLSESARTPTDLDRSLRGGIARLRRLEREVGRDLSEARALERSGRLLELGVTTFSLYCERIGLSPTEGHRLANAATACDRAPGLSAKLVRGSVSLAQAAILSRLIDAPAFERPGDDWIALAEGSTTREFIDAVSARKEEERIQDKPVQRTLFLSRKGAADLDRTSQLVSRRNGRFVSNSAAAEVALDEFVERHDPERKADRRRKRRRPKQRREQAGESAQVESAPAPESSQASAPTPGTATTRSRHLPASERHAIIERRGDRCWVDGCGERSFLDFAHHEPFRLGGPNTRRNCARYCKRHHRQLDSGAWKVRQGARGPILVDRAGIRVGRLRTRSREPSD
jgi:hypothetical protein